MDHAWAPQLTSPAPDTAAGAADVATGFHGSSYIAFEIREPLAEALRDRGEIVTATAGLDAALRHRESWTYFRDRPPDPCGPLLRLDGQKGSL